MGMIFNTRVGGGAYLAANQSDAGIILDQSENPVGSSILLGALGPLRQ